MSSKTPKNAEKTPKNGRFPWFACSECGAGRPGAGWLVLYAPGRSPRYTCPSCRDGLESGR